MKAPSVSVIIPIFNEERTVAGVVQTVLSWGKAKEVIMVDDGSKDRSAQAVSQFAGLLHLISYKSNRGKGYAVARGLSEVTSDLVFFLDGDLMGLSHQDLDQMVEPVQNHKADMTISLYREQIVRKVNPFKTLSGTRVVWTKTISPHIRVMRESGFGLELFLNDLYKDKKVLYVSLPYVSHLYKYEKQTIPAAFHSYVVAVREMANEIIRERSDDLEPRSRRVILSIQNRLKRLFEYLS